MSPRSSTPPPAPQSTDPFDLWLKRSVHGRYDAVLDERIPDDLLRLISDNRAEWETMKDRWLRLGKPKE